MRILIFGTILLTSLIPFSTMADMSASGTFQASHLSSFCLEFSAKGNHRSVEKRTCAAPGQESKWLWIGDDNY